MNLLITKPITSSLLALLLCILLFEFSHLDLWVQDYFFNQETGTWLLNQNDNSVIHFLFYSGIKKMLVVFSLVVLTTLIFFRKKAWVKDHYRGMIILLLSLLLIPLTVAEIKNISNVACPQAISHYGGTLPYVSVLHHYPKNQQPKERQRCFPAAHASGGFALLALYYLVNTPRRRKQVIIFALSIGWMMGIYKMLIGHHFLSHTVISMILAWLLVHTIAKFTGLFQTSE